MDRRHEKDPLSPELVRSHLKDHRERLQDKDPSDEDQEDFIFRRHGHDAQRGAQRQGADISHEHLRGIGVEPQKTQARRDDGGAEHRHLADTGNIRDLEVVGELEMAGHVGDQGVSRGGGHDRSDGETIQAVGKVDGVGRPDDHQHGERDIPDAQVRPDVLQEGNGEDAAEIGLPVKNYHPGQGDGHLEKELGPGGKAAAALALEFQGIVNEADHRESRRHKKGDRNVEIHDVGQEHRRGHQGENDERPSHRRRARLYRVSWRTVLADRLAHLRGRQGANQVGTQEKRDQQSHQRGQRGAKGDVAEDVEGRVGRVQGIQYIVKQGLVSRLFERL